MSKKYLLLALLPFLFLAACSSQGRDVAEKGEKELTLTLNGTGEYSAKTSKVATNPSVSIYRDNLNSLQQTAYDTILAGLLEHKSQFQLPAPFTKEKTKQVIGIILLDNPDLFYVSPKFNYTLNEAGEVTAVSLELTMDKAEADEKLKYMLAHVETLPDTSSGTMPFLAQTIGPMRDENFVLEGGNAIYDVQSLYSSKMTPYDFNRLLVYILRRKEIQASMVFGENINSLYGNGDFGKGSIQDTGSAFVYDVKNVYSWVLVNIKGSYYHVDTYMNAAFGAKIRSLTQYEADFTPYIGMTDKFASNSRLMSLNEEFLGVFPTAEETSFSYVHTGGFSSKATNETDFVAKLSKKYNEDAVSGTVFSSLSFISENEDFLRISQGLDIGLKKLTKGKRNLKTYKSFIDPFSQCIYLYDMVFDNTVGTSEE